MLLAETRYPKVERMCLALVFAAQHISEGKLSHPVHLITKSDPLFLVTTRFVRKISQVV